MSLGPHIRRQTLLAIIRAIEYITFVEARAIGPHPKCHYNDIAISATSASDRHDE